MNLKHLWLNLKERFQDPHSINSDWDDFKKMNAIQLREEFSRLLDDDKTNVFRSNRDASRLTRLCHFIALHWTTDTLPDEDIQPDTELGPQPNWEPTDKKRWP